jgi:type 1 fimbria pilin
MKAAIKRQRGMFGIVMHIGVGFLLICAFFISATLAQSENGSASFEGTVRDQTGAVVQGRP